MGAISLVVSQLVLLMAGMMLRTFDRVVVDGGDGAGGKGAGEDGGEVDLGAAVRVSDRTARLSVVAEWKTFCSGLAAFARGSRTPGMSNAASPRVMTFGSEACAPWAGVG